jgi:hypothetical protein
MDYASFNTLEQAKAHRANNGGWLFVSDDSVIWFKLGFTPSTIFLHKATSGMSGRLI